MGPGVVGPRFPGEGKQEQWPRVVTDHLRLRCIGEIDAFESGFLGLVGTQLVGSGIGRSRNWRHLFATKICGYIGGYGEEVDYKMFDRGYRNFGYTLRLRWSRYS